MEVVYISLLIILSALAIILVVFDKMEKENPDSWRDAIDLSGSVTSYMGEDKCPLGSIDLDKSTLDELIELASDMKNCTNCAKYKELKDRISDYQDLQEEVGDV